MKILSIINQKGGVGKTTVSIHLGAKLAQLGYKVMCIDFDPQMNLSQGYKIEEDYPYTVFDFLNGSGSFQLKQKEENLYIMSGALNLDSKFYDRNLLKDRLQQLNDALIQQKKGFDFVILDCQPQPLVDKKDDKNKSVPILNEIALIASNHIIVPLGVDEYSIKGLDNFIPGILRIKKNYNPSLTIAGIFFNKVLSNEKNFRRFYKLLENSGAKEFFLEDFIRKDVKIEEAVREGKTIFQLAPKSRAARDFEKVCNHILKNINL